MTHSFTPDAWSDHDTVDDVVNCALSPEYAPNPDGVPDPRHARTATMAIQLAHRTIRAFEDGPLPEDEVQALAEVALRTATSNGLQMASIIRVKKPESRQKIAEICTQPYVAMAPELWVFVVDCHRAASVVEENGGDPACAGTMDSFFQGWTDATLMAQNVVVAAESLGLGTCFLGSLLNNPRELIEVLGLPRYTFPVLGLLLGRPAQKPQMKPRMPLQFRMFDDVYQHFPSYHEALKEYDDVIREYYDLRNTNARIDYYTKQLAARVEKNMPLRRRIVREIAEQGFAVDLLPENIFESPQERQS